MWRQISASATVAAFVVLAAASGLIANQMFSRADPAPPRGPLSYLPR